MLFYKHGKHCACLKQIPRVYLAIHGNTRTENDKTKTENYKIAILALHELRFDKLLKNSSKQAFLLHRGSNFPVSAAAGVTVSLTEPSWKESQTDLVLTF